MKGRRSLEIERALFGLLDAGPEAISVDAVAKLARVSVKTVYRVAGSPEVLRRIAAEAHLAKLSTRLAQVDPGLPTRERVRELVRAVVPDEHWRGLLTVLARLPLGTVDWVAAYIEALFPDLPDTTGLGHGVLGILRAPVAGRWDPDRAELRKVLYRMVLVVVAKP